MNLIISNGDWENEDVNREEEEMKENGGRESEGESQREGIKHTLPRGYADWQKASTGGGRSNERGEEREAEARLSKRGSDKWSL